MKTNHTNKKAMAGMHPEQEALLGVIASLYAEIDSYRSKENAKAGHDIGWERAAKEWMQTHFLDWKRRHWEPVVEQALQTPSVTANMASYNHWRQAHQQ